MSGDASAVLALPFILPAQAQKHVTHNEALRLLDVLVQPAVASRSVAAPPPGAAAGTRHIVPAGGSGAFAGQAGRIAVAEAGGWAFLTPLPGWCARVLDEAAVEVVFDGSQWTGPAETVQRFAGVGIATPADAVNRLAVAAPATLLTHQGAGHQLKINKAAAADTASLLFQTGWSGRAEMGTAGADDFQIRTSADGVNFQTALRALAASGRIALPAGLTLAPGTAAAPGLAFEGDPDTGLARPAADVLALVAGGTERARVTASGVEVAGLLTGSAVMQSNIDTTAGRLMAVGAFGLGEPGNAGKQLTAAGEVDTLRGWRIDRVLSANALSVGLPVAVGGTVMTIGWAATNQAQMYFEISGSGRIWQRFLSSGTWQPWRLLYSQGTLLGTVSLAGGVPTGAVIETGSNANGTYTRHADGTQTCSRSMAAASGAAATWTFPAAFSAAPVVTGSAVATVMSSVVLDAAPTATAASFSARDKADARRADTVHLFATGRWA